MSEEISTKGKEELFAIFTVERLNSFEREVRETKQYHDVQVRKTEIYKQLEEAIPEKMQTYLKRFAQLWEDMSHYHSQYCYSRGFDDSMMFHSHILGKSKTGGFPIRKESQNGR